MRPRKKTTKGDRGVTQVFEGRFFWEHTELKLGVEP